MIEAIKTYILAEWAVISSAPVTIFLALSIMAAVIWVVISWSYGTIVSHQAAEIKLLERQKNEATARPVSGKLEDRAELRLQMFGDERAPDRMLQTNIWRWYYLRHVTIFISKETGQRVERVSPFLFVTFDQPVELGTLEVRSDQPLPRHEVKEFTNRYALIAFYDAIPAGNLAVTVRK